MLEHREQYAENINYIYGFPGYYGYECTESRPAGYEGGIIAKGAEGIRHSAACYGQHCTKLAIAKRYRYHHNQGKYVAQRRGQGAAASCHPAVYGYSPAHADYGAKAYAEKVNGRYLFCLVHFACLLSSTITNR